MLLQKPPSSLQQAAAMPCSGFCLWLAQGPLLAPTLAPWMLQDHFSIRVLRRLTKTGDQRVTDASTMKYFCLHSLHFLPPMMSLVCGPFGRQHYMHIQPLHHEPGRVIPAKNTRLNLLQRQTKKASEAKLSKAKKAKWWEKQRKDIPEKCSPILIKKCSTLHHMESDTHLGYTDPSKASLQQLLPPGVQAVQFFHHGCRETRTQIKEGTEEPGIFRWEWGITVSKDSCADESRLFLAIWMWKIPVLSHQ